MTVVPAQQGGGGSSGLYDILELILDRGLVIDAFVRVSVIGIEILRIDVRIVVASVDTYLRFAEACNRLDLEGRRQTLVLPDHVGDITESGARDATRGELFDAPGTISDADRWTRDDGRAERRPRTRRSTDPRKKEELE
ncbi:gas vesicle protein GvpJ [Streptomyces sp. NPDC001401]|uniref:gas vesicle protein GvpJ n=1 Tax=Streptomyces sp. NPDC001401 TaxID=3364570 RepID=UPI0036B87424